MLHYLDVSCVCSVSGVNVHWSEACRSEWLWRQWFISSYPHTTLVGEQQPIDRDGGEQPGSIPWREQMRRRSTVAAWVRHTLSSARHSPRIEGRSSSSGQQEGWRRRMDRGEEREVGDEGPWLSSAISSPSFLPSSPVVPRSAPVSIPSAPFTTSAPSLHQQRQRAPSLSQSPSPLSLSPLCGARPCDVRGVRGGVGGAGVGVDVDVEESAAASSPPWVFRTPPSSRVGCVRFDGQSLLVGLERDLRLYSLTDGAMLGQISRAHAAPITSCDVSMEGPVLVSASRDCTLRWFDVDSFACRRVSVKRGGHVDCVTAIRILPSCGARRVASIALDGALKVWDSERGQVSSSHNSDDVAALGLLLSLDVVHPSSLTFITGSTRGGANRVGEGRVAMWDLRTASGVTSSVTLPCGLMTAVSYSSYQQAIAAGGSDGLVRIFDARKMNISTSAQHTLHIPTHSTTAYQHHHQHTGAITAPSTSPPSPSAPALSAQAAAVCHLQSLCLLPDRLLTCQSRAFTVFACASSAPARLRSAALQAFPYAFPVHSISPREVQRWSATSAAPPSLAFSAPTPSLSAFGSPVSSAAPSLVSFQYDERSDVLALASQQAVLVWNARHRLQTTASAAAPQLVADAHYGRRHSGHEAPTATSSTSTARTSAAQRRSPTITAAAQSNEGEGGGAQSASGEGGRGGSGGRAQAERRGRHSREKKASRIYTPAQRRL